MPYSAFAVQGTKLQIKVGSVFTDIPGVEGLSGPTGTKQQIDVTAINDTAAKFVAGLPDYGEVTFRLFWDPSDTTHQELLTAYNTANSSSEFQIVCSDAGAAVIAFAGQVTGWQWSFEKGQAATAEVTIKVSGNVTITP
jgi:hypothetical protein